ncbi:MAG: DUF5662 family protein [Candidatus Humimicrobiaceae bacterium]
MIEKYNQYIIEHVTNVRLSWKMLQPKLIDKYWLDDYYYHIINERVETHDISKLTDNEFNGYRQFFYPYKEEEPNKNILDKSWLHHIHKNDHHWEYWVICGVNNTAVDMPLECIFEMLLDWAAMSIKFGDTPRQFYDTNKGTMIFHENTSKYIESIIDLFTFKVGNLNEELAKKMTKNGNLQRAYKKRV